MATDITSNHPAGGEPVTCPPRCLSFTVRSQWGHFRRFEGNIVKQTYRVLPRTTASGLIAAICGLPRDSYYDEFSRGNSALAIQPIGDLRTINIPVNTLSTSPGKMKSLVSGKVSVKTPDSTAPRQQHNYEVLVNPAYRVDVWISDDSLYETLQSHLEEGTSHYAPSMGLSEYLASIKYHGEFEPELETGDVLKVNSAVPNASSHLIPEPGVLVEYERSSGYMRMRNENGRSFRTTAAHIDFAYCPEGDTLSVSGENVEAAHVDGRTVIFT